MQRTPGVEAAQPSPVTGPNAPAGSRAWLRPGIVASTIALLTAPVVWIAVAVSVTRGDIAYAMPGGVDGFIALAALSCVLDLGAAWLIIKDRARGLMLGYLAVRALLAAIGIIFLALPSYAVGAAALFASPRPSTAAVVPHAYVPLSATTGSAITLNARLFSSDWSRMSRPAGEGPRCTVCGEPEGAPIHEVEPG